MQEKDKQAYEQLLLGIQGYVDKCLENSFVDRTTTAIVKYADDEDFTLYTITLDGKTYHNVPTIGGICGNNEMVRVLIPQGNYSNMFILKGGNNETVTISGGGSNGGGSSAVTSVNGQVGNVVLSAHDLNGLMESDRETEDIDFSKISVTLIDKDVADISTETVDIDFNTIIG